MVINDASINFDKNILNASISFVNDGIHNPMLNVTFDIYRVIEKIMIYVKINVPENAHDQKFGKEFFRTVFDYSKIVNGF